MTRREVVMEALQFRRPPYVPWAWDMTQDCAERLKAHLGAGSLTEFVGSHFLDLASHIGRFDRLDEDRYRDVYGVVWDRSVDKDIGTPIDWPIRRPEDLDGYTWPDPADDSWYAGIAERMAANRDLFTRFPIGFSLYERAWTMRGMTELLIDMVERPEFVEKLMDRIVEHNLVQVRRAISFDVDCVHFGDDYGMQSGLIMGAEHWRHFIKPRLARMFEPASIASRIVAISPALANWRL